ncbi:uncharacterized protein K452DRAFT_160035 [Aplosporella prunicola CBS 121167]|uniref:Secreted protein n=1 Tax=Aplosporella prunicola CBS 121167 TaxID=1176127 RepID=A0A6A6BHI9_9PEZI|nr:uncharacterized protein K452DRAFT_160035 [Aplosporella prunicola CBS 121167]KAF2143610.1 hypothetical protein K452DRAFT_160035 [Aplosporella prunicola CBS 121167]
MHATRRRPLCLIPTTACSFLAPFWTLVRAEPAPAWAAWRTVAQALVSDAANQRSHRSCRRPFATATGHKKPGALAHGQPSRATCGGSSTRRILRCDLYYLIPLIKRRGGRGPQPCASSAGRATGTHEEDVHREPGRPSRPGCTGLSPEANLAPGSNQSPNLALGISHASISFPPTPAPLTSFPLSRRARGEGDST